MQFSFCINICIMHIVFFIRKMIDLRVIRHNYL